MNIKSTVVTRAPQSRGISASLRRLAARRAMHALTVGLALAGSLHSASAAPFNYTGGTGTAGAPASGNFSTGFDTDVTTSTTADTLSFGGAAGGASYTATDDLATTINANALSFSNIAGIVATLARGTNTGANNSITLGTTGSTAPTVTSGAGAVVNGLDLILANNTTFNIGAGGMTQTAASVISGSGSFTKTGAGGLILSGNNTYTGGTIVSSSGGLAIGSDTALGTGTLTFNTSQFLAAVNGNRTIANNVIFGTNRLVIDNNGSFNTGLTTGSLTINGNVAFNMTGPGDLFLRNNLILNGVVSGSNSNAGILLNGNSGTLTLTNAANTFTGGINYAVGATVNANSDAALGAAANAIAFNAGGSNGTLQAGASFATARGISAVSGVTGKIDTQAFTLTDNGIISGAGSITKVGTGTLVLSNANTLTGNTTVSAGTLDLTNSLALQSSILTPTATGTVVFDTSVASHAFTLGGLSGTGNLALQDNAATPNAIALSVGNNNTSTTGIPTTSPASYNGALSGAGSLTKVGTGTTALGGANTYTGGTTVSAGTLALIGTNDVGTGAISVTGGSLALGINTTGTNGNNALTAANAVTLAAGTNLTINQTNTPLTYAAFPLTMNGNSSLTFAGGNLYTDTFTSPITLNNTGGAQAATIGEADAANTINLQGIISGTGDLKIAPGGNGNPFKVTINKAETYSGNTFLTEVTGPGDYPNLQLLAGGSLPSSTVLTLTTGTTAPTRFTTFDLNGQAQTLAGLASGGTVATAAGNAVINSTNGTTTTLTINNAAAFTYGGKIGTAATNNNIALTKTGAGQQNLTGSNIYTGGTTVNGGTLALSAAAADGTGTLVVNSGGTTTVTANNALGGGNVTLAGGTLQNAVTAPGTLPTTNQQTSGILSLTTATASTLDFGAANLGATFTFTGFDAANTGSLSIINYLGTPLVGSGLDQLFVAGTPLTAAQLGQFSFITGGVTFTATQLASGEIVENAPAAAPEPSQYAAFGIGLLGLGALALKAKKRSLAA